MFDEMRHERVLVCKGCGGIFKGVRGAANTKFEYLGQYAIKKESQSSECLQAFTSFDNATEPINQ
jgi:hypothetical protein